MIFVSLFRLDRVFIRSFLSLLVSVHVVLNFFEGWEVFWGVWILVSFNELLRSRLFLHRDGFINILDHIKLFLHLIKIELSILLDVVSKFWNLSIWTLISYAHLFVGLFSPQCLLDVHINLIVNRFFLKPHTVNILGNLFVHNFTW